MKGITWSRSGGRRRRLKVLTAAIAPAALVGVLAVYGTATGVAASSVPGSSSAVASAAALPGTGKPTIVIGDKNFAEENILGELYAQALTAKGYKVNLKNNLGSSELIYKALVAHQINFYPEYTGTLLTAVANQTKEPSSAASAYKEAKAFVQKHGFTLLNYTPFYDSDALATLPAYAKAHKLSSIANLKSLGSGLTLGGPPEFATRFEGLIGLKQLYGVVPTFKPIAIELSYQALESKQVNVQLVFSTDGQLLSGKFKVLADPKHLFGYQNVAPVVTDHLVKVEGAAFAQTVNKVSSLLTIPAIQQMNKAVSIDKLSAASVAKEFLKANHLG